MSLSEAVRPPWMIRTRSKYFVILAAAFITFSAIVASGVTFQADDAVSRYFKSIQGSNPSIDTAMIVITSLGDVTTLFIVGIALTIIRRTRKVGMIFLIALVLIVVLVMYIKPLIGRQIPPYGFEPASKLPENFSLESDSLAPFAAGFSYPSGHASRTTALAFIAGYAIYNKSKKMGYAIWAFPVIIGITRIYVMQHYPTDIIGGFMFGGLVSVVLSNAMKLEEPFFLSRIKGKEDKAL
ncbi:MAG: phosphatase PAP2 family protein [Thermoproteota archaeon]|nr:phosphatase PAP2 family protein [Thermoproteota archaeon]